MYAEDINYALLILEEKITDFQYTLAKGHLLPDHEEDIKERIELLKSASKKIKGLETN